MKTRMVMASHFVKINLGFILKWPEKMLAFIQSQPNIVERLLKHIECSSFVDLIVQIISLDEHQSCGEVIEWLSSQQFVPRLVDMLSPEYSSDMHNAVADLIKGIISMATPTPASGLIDSPPVSNLFARELASKEIVDKLVSYIVHDFSVPKPPSTSSAPIDSTSSSTNTETTTESEFDADRLPSLDSSVSSVTNSISIIIELIRKNNSDYFEPYLFHTLRNRLIHFQQHLTEEAGKNPDETREMLEQAMADLVNRMGVVNLSFVLSGVGEKMHELKIFLREPRSLVGNIQTTVGTVTPLTFERFRISELLAELLHCSNMALLNRPSIHDNLYDSKGRLQGGLSALEDLAQVIQLNGTSDGEDKSGFDGGDTTEEDSDDDDDDDGLGASGSSGGMSDIEPAMDLPISGGPGSKLSSQQLQQGDDIGATVERDTPSIGSSDMSPGSSDAEDDDDSESGGGEGDVERMEEISMHDEPTSGKEGLKIDTSPKTMLDVGVGSDSSLSASPTALAPSSSKHARSSAEGGSGDIDIQMSTGSSSEFDDHALTPQLSRTSKASNSRRSSRKMTTESAPDLSQTPGSKLKRLFLDLEILPTLLDLFFEFKWNNFLHSAVYDVIHQILTGNVESGLNRDLVISLFKDAKLMQRIVEGQKLNDIESTKSKGVRIGYMGHLTLLAEDVISAIDRFPTDLQTLIITSYAPRPEWEDYVKGRYSETKKKDRIALGGPKPSASVSSTGFSGSSSGSGGGGNGVFGFDGDGVEAKAFGAGAGVGGGVGVGGGGGIGRMAVDETAMFPGLRLDETNADTFAPRSSTKSSSRIEIEQGDIEGIASGPGGVERKADVPEDVGGSSSSSSSSRSNGGGRSGGPTGEFRRIGFDGGNKSSSRRSAVAGVRNTADFGPSVVGGHEDEDEEDEEKYGNSRTTHFARYLAQEIQSSNHIGESSDSSDEEEGGWLSQSNFNLGSPPISARRLQAERRPLDVSGFDDSFVPPTSSSTNPFSHDDDTFGPFSDAAATSNPSDSVLLSSSSFSDEMDDSSFESFGDFGDFHSADGAFDVDFGPFESAAPSSSSGPATVTGLSSTSTTTTTPSINTSSSSRVKDGDDDDDSSLTLTPTSGSGSWTIATGNDGFEEIRRA
ncbi:Extragenic suppressor of kinetochore protein 1 [Leucoagaricus sp. SymC.cos]|nr:Extragenic suppressor of kinetochore protein 1 [Leucoagaricus sp. SymC.cos]